MKRVLLGVMLIVLTVAAAACGGETDARPDIEFGSDVLPATLPEDFPIPGTGTISSTLVNRDLDTTEMIVRASGELASVIQFYTQSLPAAGFTIVQSEQNGTGWDMAIDGRGLAGTVEFTLPTVQVVQMVFKLDGEVTDG